LVDAPAPRGARRPPSAQSAAGGWGDDWSPATPVRSASAPAEAPPAVRRPAPPVRQRQQPPQELPPEPHRPPEHGLPGWAALVVLLVIAAIGGLIDSLSGAQVRGGFNYGIVIASILAILMVRRSAMFPIVIAPPIVYSAASAAMLYVRSSGLHDRKVLFDGAANWLVYGFPAIAAATAAVLIIAGIRIIARR
jgi:hypothetical protein